MKKFSLCVFLSFALIINSIPLAAYASMATASDLELNIDDEWIGDDGELVATSSNADLEARIDDLVNFADVPMLMSDGDTPTIYPYADVHNNGRWVTTVRGTYAGRSGSNNYFTFPARTDGSKYTNIFFRVQKSALPSPGTYGVQWRHNQAHISYEYYSSYAIVEAYKNGVKTASSSVDALQTFGDYCVSEANVTIGYNTTLVSLSTSITPVTQLDVNVPVDEPYFFSFQKNSGNTVVSPDVSAGQTAQDAIADSSGQIANNTASMADTLKEIVQTISNQLAALWDQMYNLMHVPQLANDDKNTNLIIQNEQQNTEQVTGAIEEHGNFIINGLKGLFIPSDDFFKSYFDDLYEWFSGKFGFLTIPIDIFIQIMGVFTSSDRVDFVLTLPPLSIMGESLWAEQSFNFTDFCEEHFSFLLTAVQTGTSILLILSFVDLCRRKYEEVMRN